MYRPAPEVVWNSEPNGVRVTPPSGDSVKLGYPDAALWDFMTRGIAEGRLILMLRHIGGFPDEAAVRTFVSSRLEEWRRLSLVVSG